MGNSSYFRFDDDNKTKYIHYLNHHKGMGKTENTQPHILYNGQLREYDDLLSKVIASQADCVSSELFISAIWSCLYKTKGRDWFSQVLEWTWRIQARALGMVEFSLTLLNIANDWLNCVSQPREASFWPSKIKSCYEKHGPREGHWTVNVWIDYVMYMYLLW